MRRNALYFASLSITMGYMSKIVYDAQIIIRMTAKERKMLEKEAAEVDRTLSNYIRNLLATHQDRQKKKT